jgi:hypothetical protein
MAHWITKVLLRTNLHQTRQPSWSPVDCSARRDLFSFILFSRTVKHYRTVKYYRGNNHAGHFWIHILEATFRMSSRLQLFIFRQSPEKSQKWADAFLCQRK